ncbi:MAG: hypothetical protein HC802_09475 [Caldilineaceae bacterium]|nr:hypothetical protein [Caldilineaceae bacterium]
MRDRIFGPQRAISPRLCRMAAPLFLGLLPLALLLTIFQTTFAAGITVNVDNTLDDNSKQGCTGAANDCSLRGAISKANDDAVNEYTIVIPAGHYTLTQSGAGEDANATGDLDLTRPMTLSGALDFLGPVTPTEDLPFTLIDANRIDRVLHIHNGADTTLSSLWIQSGQAPASSNGGGIYNVGSRVTLSTVVVISNTATNGGGIYNQGSTAVISSASLIYPVDNSAADHGGAIYNDGGWISFTDVWAQANKAGGDGGALYNKNGHIESTGGLLYLLTNRAGGNGGGLVNDGAAAMIDQKGRTFIFENKAEGGVGGGGILNLAGRIALSTTLLYDNEAPAGDGGGIYNVGGRATLSGSLIFSNSAKLDGGGIYNDRGEIILSEFTIYRNSAEWGGGILNDGALGSAAITLTDGIVVANSAASDGGGFFNVDAQTTVRDTWVYSNTAIVGGGIYNEAGQFTFSDGLLTGNGGHSEWRCDLPGGRVGSSQSELCCRQQRDRCPIPGRRGAAQRTAKLVGRTRWTLPSRKR